MTLIGSDNGVFLAFGANVGVGIQAKVCPGEKPKIKGFVSAKAYGGVRVSFQLPVSTKWLKAVGFAEGGGYASAKWELPSFALMNASAGGYIRARAEFTFKGMIWNWQETYEYSQTWCKYGTCGNVDDLGFD